MNCTKVHIMLAMLGGLVVFSDCFAQDDIKWGGYTVPSLARGVDQRAVLQSSTKDNVNISNGVVTFSIPLGQSYPVGPGFDYQLTLIGTSQPWDYQQDTCSYKPFVDQSIFFDVNYPMAVPSPLSNAGMGWSLNLGRILEKKNDIAGRGPTPLRPDLITFVDQTGATHSFVDNTFGTEVYQGLNAEEDVYYSSDGSLLRYKQNIPASECLNTSSSSGNCRTVEFPDGKTMEFFDISHLTHSKDPWGEEQLDLRVTRIKDKAGHFIKVTYEKVEPADPTNPEDKPESYWLIEDSHGRKQYVYFAHEENGYAFNRISRVVVETFNNAPAEYKFLYPSEPVTLPRHRFGAFAAKLEPECRSLFGSDTTIWDDPANHGEVQVSLLQTIENPDGSKIRIAYGMDDSYVNSGDLGGDISGGISAIQDEFEVETEYLYSDYRFSDYTEYDKQYEANGQAALTLGSPSNNTPGLIKKTINSTSTNETQVWQYSQKEVFTNSPLALCHREVIVTDPVGNKTVNFFNAYKLTNGGGSPHPKALSNQTFTFCEEGSAENGQHSGQVGYNQEILAVNAKEGLGYLSRVHVDSSNQWVIKEYTKLEQISTLFDMDIFAEDWRSNHSGMKYWKDTDQPTHKITNSKNKNALGFYGRIESRGDFSHQDNRTTITNYSGTPGTAEAWILGRVDQTEEYSEIPNNISKFVTKYCYQDARFPTMWTGKRNLKSIATNPNEDNHDLFKFRQFSIQSNGRRLKILEKSYGGDLHSLNGHNGCNNPGLMPEYMMRTDYNYGVEKVKGYLLPTNSAAFNDPFIRVDFDDQIDKSTGFVATSTDATGVTSQFRFDKMSRLVRAKATPDSALMLFRYNLPSANNNPASLQTIVCDTTAFASTCPNEITRTKILFDGFGRAYKKLNQVSTDAGITEVESVTYFDALSRVIKQHEWRKSSQSGTENNLFYKKSDYDYFGRPGLVELPGQENAANDKGFVRYIYTGMDYERQTVRINTAQGMQDSASITRRNIHGDVMSLKQDILMGESRFRTYAYNVKGQLLSVCNNDNNRFLGYDQTNGGYDHCPASGQVRDMAYDGRGFMLSEKVPEQNIKYFRYDSMGNVVKSFFDFTNEGYVDSIYDKANRLIRTENFNGEPITEYFYARTDNPSLLHIRNALVQTKRHNRFPNDVGLPENVVVTESFGYQQTGARRLSKSSIRASLDDSPWFLNSNYSYDKLGHVESFSQPECRSLQCPDDPPETIHMQYVLGVPQSISGYIDNIDYELNGAIRRIDHGNGFSDLFERFQHNTDATQARWSRLSNIKLINQITGQVPWDTGTIRFDHAGNIKSVGENATFHYDLLGRLKFGQVATDSGVIASQTAEFDRHDNLLSLTNSNSSMPGMVANVNPSNNHLAEGAIYDYRGNITQSLLGATNPGQSLVDFQYDDLNKITSLNMHIGVPARKSFLYNASGHRVATLKNDQWEWTVRGLNSKPQAVFSSADAFRSGSNLNRKTDYVYLGSRQIASKQYQENGATELVHFHRDHLGSTRRVTGNNADGVIAAYDFLPFGGYAIRPSDEEAEKLQFTGHERDRGIDDATDLDYMMARYYSPFQGRFLQVDPARDGWNLYGYVGGNPMVMIDPTGLEETVGGELIEKRNKQRKQRSDALIILTGRDENGLKADVDFNFSDSGVILDSAIEVGTDFVGIKKGRLDVSPGEAFDKVLLTAAAILNLVGYDEFVDVMEETQNLVGNLAVNSLFQAAHPNGIPEKIYPESSAFNDCRPPLKCDGSDDGSVAPTTPGGDSSGVNLDDIQKDLQSQQ